MSGILQLEKFSIGVGDRFARQAKAQLRACLMAADAGAEVIPVWNKSHREHKIVGSQPDSVRQAADAAVEALGWDRSYYVDADHINLSNVDGFLHSSDFFTIDVADSIGKSASLDEIDAFLRRHPGLAAAHGIPGLSGELRISPMQLRMTAGRYLSAVQEAGRVYRYIANKKGKGAFITEVSMDETQTAQSAAELLVILAMIGDEEIPAQTIAPKFTGRFNKGVDYDGDLLLFDLQFRNSLAVIRYAVERYGLPSNLKLSVHSGSDKFSIYEPMRRAIEETGAGLHLKTAGTTWLEELIGLAEADGDGLKLAKDIYARAYDDCESLCEPYAAVIDIDEKRLPSPHGVSSWSAQQFAAALRHDRSCGAYNPHLRQLLHVAYKIAAKKGSRYLKMLDECQETVARNVTINLYERHIKPLFV